MKTGLNIVIFAALLLTVISSCTERIDLKLDDSYIRLVVEGSVTTERKSHTVILKKSSSYFYDQQPTYVSGATVTISDGYKTFPLAEAKPGVYKTDPSITGINGLTYTLNIILREPVGGHTDYTASSLLNPVSPLDSVDLMFHPDWSENGMYEVRSYYYDPPENDYYRFMVARNDTIISDTLNEWFVSDDRFINGKYVFGAPVAYLDQGSADEKLNPGDKVTIEMNNIGKEYADFIREAQSEIWGSNPLFGGPPANAKGNINNGAIGFFSAYSVSRARVFLPPKPSH